MIFDRLRATLRDPLYRCECRQARFWKTAGSWLLPSQVLKYAARRMDERLLRDG